MEITIRADENSVKDALETGGGELNVSVSTGSIEKCSSEGEAEDLLDAEGQAECHEALTAIIYPGNSSSLATAKLEGGDCDIGDTNEEDTESLGPEDNVNEEDTKSPGPEDDVNEEDTKSPGPEDDVNEEDTKSPGPEDNVDEEDEVDDTIKPSAGKRRKLFFNCSNTDEPTLVDVAPAEENLPEDEELDEEDVPINYKVVQGAGIKFDESEGGGGWKKFEIAASADDDDVVENCTKKRARDEDFENEARKAFNHAGGDGGDNNTKAVAKLAFESASWEEQEPPLTEELMKKTDDDTNWPSFDSSVNSSDDKITVESDPWAQVEIEEIHMVRAVDVQVQLMEGSRGGWPQRRPPRFERPKIEPENQEVDNIVQSMRNILFNLNNQDNLKLGEEDEAKVRALLKYHPQYTEKMGCGIEHIKINRHSTFKDVRCFWVVRTDGTETDFSYHKCLKEKIAKEIPEFVDRYDAIYRRSRTRGE